jgi:magnesium transporter
MSRNKRRPSRTTAPARQPGAVRRKLLRKTSHKAGRPPGTLMHVGEPRTAAIHIRLMDYTAENLVERQLGDATDCLACRDSSSTSWIDLDGVHRFELLEQLGADFGLHPLVLEDIVNTEHRPKVEDFDHYLFLVLKMPRFEAASATVRLEQVSLVLGPSFVLSFQEQPGDVFEGIRQRLRTARGRIRKMGPDYLAYALLDALVDSYFAILENLGGQIERLEEELIVRATPATLTAIHHFKREMILLRKAVWPLRELVAGLRRAESPLISQATEIFLRDVHDHAVQIIDTVETLRDILSGLLDLYLSNISNRMNEVMKVLTIIATVFIPLTFLAGIYGMNFEHMPELHWRWSYPLLWLAMLAMAGGMFRFFKRKGWL